jgi:hypothetical protein
VTLYNLKHDKDMIGYKHNDSYSQLSYRVFGAHRLTNIVIIISCFLIHIFAHNNMITYISYLNDKINNLKKLFYNTLNFINKKLKYAIKYFHIVLNKNNEQITLVKFFI